MEITWDHTASSALKPPPDECLGHGSKKNLLRNSLQSYPTNDRLCMPLLTLRSFYRQFGKLLEEMTLARQVIRGSLNNQSYRPLTPRME